MCLGSHMQLFMILLVHVISLCHNELGIVVHIKSLIWNAIEPRLTNEYHATLYYSTSSSSGTVDYSTISMSPCSYIGACSRLFVVVHHHAVQGHVDAS